MDDRTYLYNTATATRQDPHWDYSARTLGEVFSLLGLTPAAVLTGRAPIGEIAARCEAALAHAPQGAPFPLNGTLSEWSRVGSLLAIAQEGDPEEDLFYWGLA